MSVCSLDIKKDIIEDAGERLTKLKATVDGNVGFFANPNRASAAINEVNRHYNDLVVKEGEKGSFFIDPSPALVDEYFEKFKAENPGEVQFRPEGFYMGDDALEEQERGNLFFQTANGVKFTEEMKNKLLSFVKGLGITVEFNADDLLQSREFQRNPLAAFDVLQKFMAFASGQEKLLPRQVAAATYTFLGKKSTLSKSIWKNIKLWDKYDEVYNKYATTQKYDIGEDYLDEEFLGDEKFNPFAHKMAIVSFLEESMMRVASGETATQKRISEDIDKDFFLKRGYLDTFEKDISPLQRTFRQIYNWLRKLLTASVFEKYNREDFTQLGLDIAEDIFKNDYSKFLRGIVEKDGELYTSKGDKLELKTYDKTLANDPTAVGIIDTLINNPYINFKLSGSLTLRKYGDVFRDVKEDLHDIDGVITLDTFREDPKAFSFVQWIQTKGLPMVASKQHKKFYKEVTPLLQNLNWYQNLMYEYPNFKLTNVFIGKDHKKGESITIQGELVEDGKNYKLDFFLRTDEGNYPEIFDNYWKDWKQIFEAKLNMGRSKDIVDLIYFDPYIKDVYKFTNKGFRFFTFQDENIQNQLGPLPASTASTETLSKVKAAAKKMGISIQALADYAKEAKLDITSVNGVADLVRGVVAIAEGKEDVALTEEMVHLATAILEQTNPKMVTEMISKIDRFKIYKQVYEQYKDIYKLPNGKPDIRKIKKEAVDKLITELIINQSEGSTEYPELRQEINRSIIRGWWNSILDWIKGIYKKSNVSIFEEAAAQIVTGNVGAAYGQIKPGVQELFDSNPELASIGTAEQYSQYLDGIFPDSKVKDVVYHGSNTKFEEFLEDNLNYFGTKDIAKGYGKNIYPVVIEIKKPYYEDGGNLSNQSYEDLYDKLDESGSDGFISNDKNLFVPKTEEQIHILGNNQDLEGFREFVASAPATFKGEGVFYQLSDAQKSFQQKIEETKKFLEKKESDKKAGVDPLLLDTEEAYNFYEVTNPDGTKETGIKRVTDRVKAWFAQRFPGKTFSEAEKAFNELKRTFGVEGHKDFEEIHARYYNKDGTKKAKPDPQPKKINLPSKEMYTKLENYYVDLIKTFHKDTLIFSEVLVYDPKEKEAGTLDFVAVEPSGKTHILDWKFMYIAPDKNDVAWFKQGAYNVQLGRYKAILKDVYGVKNFGMTRAIPITMSFKPKNMFKPDAGFTLKGIAIGSANAADIEDLRLIPISEETESTGEDKLDKLIVQLNAILKQVESQEVTESEKEFKKERLNILRQTIRIIQATTNISPLIETIEVMRKEGERIINDYNVIYKDRPANSKDSENKDLSDFSDDMNNFLQLSSVFSDIGLDIGDLIWNENMTAKTKIEKEDLKQRKESFDKLNYEALQIRKSTKEITEVSRKFADKHIGQRNLVVGLLRPEAVVKGLSSIFRGVSELPLASLNILYKLTGIAQDKAKVDSQSEVNELMEIRDKIVKRGGDVRKFIQQLYQKDDKNNLVNKLIFKYSKDFRETVDAKFIEGGDRNWLLQNIDVEAYKAESKKVIVERIEQIKKMSLSGTDAEVKAKRKKLAEDVLLQFDITRKDFTGFNNFIIKRHPLPKWYSEEYKKIEKDADLLNLYNFIVKFNEKSKDVGYIDNQVSKTFLPFVRKTMAEELSMSNVLSAIGKFGDSLKIKVDDVGLGDINQITGELQNSIPKYYTHDFTKGEDGVNDYSDVSEDLFKNIILYVQQVNKYKYMTEVEGQLNLVKTVEQFKETHLRTNRVSNVVLKNGKPEEEKGNKENTKMYDEFLRVLLYGQKYVLSDSDTPLYIGKVTDFIKGALNKVTGKEIFKPNEKASPTSLIKLMDAANRGFQIKTLGWEIIPGIVNLFGGNVQMMAQAGNYFKSKEFRKNEIKILSQQFTNDEDKKTFIELINTFMPMKDDPSYEMYKEAGLSKLTQVNLGDMLMITMRYPEQLIEKSTFLTLLDNSMVVDGRIVNIREYVNDKYKAKFKNSTTYHSSKELIESEIEQLKSTKSISATKKLENGKLVIPGLDLTNRDELRRLTNLSKNIAKNAMGNLTEGDINRMSMSIWTKSMMVFKGWIPKLADTRFSELRKVIDDFSVEVKYDEEGNAYTEGQKYEIGRLRLLGYVFMKSFTDKSTSIVDILKVNDNGILALDKMYVDFAKSYEERTGEKFTMDETEFKDMIINNLQNQIRELLVLGSLIGAMLAMGLIAPDDDEDKATKNAYRYAQKVVDKFVNELSFFYNPIEFEKILSGNMFPAIGLVTDMTKFLKHFWMQITGLDFDPETSFDDVRKKAMPIKYAAKSLPVTKSLLTYGSMISEDFAKEFDITIQKESGIR
jgi:hypothetical protein